VACGDVAGEHDPVDVELVDLGQRSPHDVAVRRADHKRSA